MSIYSYWLNPQTALVWFQVQRSRASLTKHHHQILHDSKPKLSWSPAGNEDKSCRNQDWLTGWWLTYASEKYEFVSGEHDNPWLYYLTGAFYVGNGWEWRDGMKISADEALGTACSL